MGWLEEGDGDSHLQEPLRHDRLPMEVLAQKMAEEYERGERLVRKLHVLDHLIQAHEGSPAVEVLTNACSACEMILHGHEIEQPCIHDACNRRYRNCKRCIQ